MSRRVLSKLLQRIRGKAPEQESDTDGEVLASLQAAVVAHGLSVVRRADSLFVDDSRLELQARIFERDARDDSVTVVLEIHAYSTHLDGKAIVECFVGIGSSRDKAISNAFGKMLLGSFHVLVEALTTHRCEAAQAEIEHWQRGQVAWRVFSGPLLAQYSGTSTLCETYAGFLAGLNALFVESARPGPHWVRVFLGTYHGQVQVGEVLLDNEPWEEAHALLLAQDWTCTQEYQSVRQFILALPE